MLRGIANKKGDIRLTLYIYEFGVRIDELAFEILAKEADKDDPKRKFWKEQLGSKVKPHVESCQKSTTPGGWQGSRGYDHDGYPYHGGYDGVYGGTRAGGHHRKRRKFAGTIFGAIASGTDVPAGTTTPAAGASGPVGGNPADGQPPGTGALNPTGGGQVPAGIRFDGEFSD
jgi:hypothetical protein